MRVFILILLFIGSVSQAQVWSNTNSWNAQWEQKYSAWVQTEWTTDFFSRKNLRNGRILTRLL